MERFFKSYKKEEWIGDQVYYTREAAIRDMQEYMKYYDGVRLHSTLGYRSPMEYENGLSGVSGLEYYPKVEMLNVEVSCFCKLACNDHGKQTL